MTVCRTCRLPWDHMNSHFTVCPSCRAKMPVRRVNGKPLNRRWKPLPEIPEYEAARHGKHLCWTKGRPLSHTA